MAILNAKIPILGTVKKSVFVLSAIFHMAIEQTFKLARTHLLSVIHLLIRSFIDEFQTTKKGQKIKSKKLNSQKIKNSLFSTKKCDRTHWKLISEFILLKFKPNGNRASFQLFFSFYIHRKNLTQSFEHTPSICYYFFLTVSLLFRFV